MEKYQPRYNKEKIDYNPPIDLVENAGFNYNNEEIEDSVNQQTETFVERLARLRGVEIKLVNEYEPENVEVTGNIDQIANITANNAFDYLDHDTDNEPEPVNSANQISRNIQPIGYYNGPKIERTTKVPGQEYVDNKRANIRDLTSTIKSGFMSIN